MMSNQSFGVVLLGSEHFLLHPLAKAVLRNSRDDLAAVLLLRHDPAHHLVEGLGSVSTLRRGQLYGLDHGFADGFSSLLNFSNDGGIVKDPTGHLAVSSTKTKDQVKGGFLLNVIIRKGASVLELLPGEDQTLLIRGNALLILNLRLDIINGIRRLDVQSDGLAREGLDEDLHAAAKTQYQVEGGFLLDVVVGEGAAVLELLSGEDETLLIRGDALLVLDLGLDVVDGVGGLDVEGDGLSGEGLYEDLHGDGVGYCR
mmetsp:Transcript_23860/g.49945  ORF Transcript_23860/g.49945 Transcript_23860/m.49945 type:complete len:257 (+) Transcript_23860:233-1003(+)